MLVCVCLCVCVCVCACACACMRTLQGLGTDDHTLVRVMVTRCEVDMEDIKDIFYKNYHKTLGSFLKVCLSACEDVLHIHTYREIQVVTIDVS